MIKHLPKTSVPITLNLWHVKAGILSFQATFQATPVCRGHARAVLAKIGAYRCPPFTPPEQTRFEVSTVGKVVTQTADPGQLLKLPEGGGSPTWVTDGWTQVQFPLL